MSKLWQNRLKAVGVRVFDLIAVAVAVEALFRLHSGLIRSEELLVPLVEIIAAMAVGEFIRGIEHIGDDEDRLELRNGLRTLVEQSRVDQSNIRLEKCPDGRRQYVALWGGFTGYYYAYNPAYSIESGVGMEKSEAIQLFVPRYNDDEFIMAYYLFFTGDPVGKKDLEVFKQLMRLVRAKCPKVEKKIKVFERDDLAAAQFTEVYFGTRNFTPTAILEPKEPALTGPRGQPFCYLLVTDSEVLTKLKAMFKADWDKAKEVPNHEIFTP
jgi:hypothetical protein